jgi:hypothetical protein
MFKNISSPCMRPPHFPYGSPNSRPTYSPPQQNYTRHLWDSILRSRMNQLRSGVAGQCVNLLMLAVISPESEGSNVPFRQWQFAWLAWWRKSTDWPTCHSSFGQFDVRFGVCGMIWEMRGRVGDERRLTGRYRLVGDVLMIDWGPFVSAKSKDKSYIIGLVEQTPVANKLYRPDATDVQLGRRDT